MAINEQKNLLNDHHLIIAQSGAGKSHLTKHLVKKSGLPAKLLWDPNRDHHAQHFDNLRTWYRESLKAVTSGAKKYALAYKSPDPTTKEFLQWCALVWTLLDGYKPKTVVVEELADVITTAGIAPKEWGRLSKQGRKYGAQLFVTAQYAQEIDKTVVRNCRHKFIGNQSDDAKAAKYASEYLGVSVQDVLDIPDYNFFYKRSSPNPQAATLFKAPK